MTEGDLLSLGKVCSSQAWYSGKYAVSLGCSSCLEPLGRAREESEGVVW